LAFSRPSAFPGHSRLPPAFVIICGIF
jgi:hypothetical protein